MVSRTRRYHLLRHEDASDVSGIGIVAVGIQFPSGACVHEWTVPPASLNFYQSVQDVLRVHGHHGKTEIVWDD